MNLQGEIRYLVGADANYSLSGRGFILHNLTALLASLDHLGFTVSRTLFDTTLSKYVTQFKQQVEKQGEEKAVLGDAAQEFTEQVSQFEKTVRAEALTRTIALFVPKRIPLEHLLRAPGNLLGAGVYDALTNMAKEDIRQSCKCIAFECPTAAAFHILRCIEECVRTLYRSYFPRKKMEKKTWGQLTTELKQKTRRPKPDQTLLAHLDHIRDRFRNPTDHPDKVYDVEEAEDLLHLAADIINRCTRDHQVASNTRKAPA
jgi:hypothetical protein